MTSTGVVWMAITVLALVAIRRRRQRSTEMHARWDDEERTKEARILAFPSAANKDETIN